MSKLTIYDHEFDVIQEYTEHFQPTIVCITTDKDTAKYVYKWLGLISVRANIFDENLKISQAENPEFYDESKYLPFFHYIYAIEGTYGGNKIGHIFPTSINIVDKDKWIIHFSYFFSN